MKNIYYNYSHLENTWYVVGTAVLATVYGNVYI